jgi:two-component system phosphate regulon response regulator PhoB
MATVLIIEDDAEIRNVYGYALEQHGFAVLQADNAQSGLDMINQNQPDVVLLDMLMPGTSGLDMLKESKMHQRYPHIKVVVFSNIDTPRVTQQAKELGVAAYLLKVETTPSQLVEAIQRLQSDAPAS